MINWESHKCIHRRVNTNNTIPYIIILLRKSATKKPQRFPPHPFTEHRALLTPHIPRSPPNPSWPNLASCPPATRFLSQLPPESSLEENLNQVKPESPGMPHSFPVGARGAVVHRSTALGGRTLTKYAAGCLVSYRGSGWLRPVEKSAQTNLQVPLKQAFWTHTHTNKQNIS